MIEKTLISEEDRLDFLPKYLGDHFFKFETLVYSFMDKFCIGYTGGYWNFYGLSNGGMFMSYATDEECRIVNAMNYFEDTLSAEAASIALNIFALNALICQTRDEKIFDLYEALRDFAAEHPEGAKIYRFID